MTIYPIVCSLGIRIQIPIAMDCIRGKMWKAIKMTLKNNQLQSINFIMNNGDELPQLTIDFLPTILNNGCK